MEIIQMQKAAADRGSPICHRTAYPDPNKRRTDITVPFVNFLTEPQVAIRLALPRQALTTE